jgi:16S rRNA (guanine966-N2)-methyltransferase
MRISAGEAKGVRLVVPEGIRPTSEKVRQAVLTSLGSVLEGARVLDLFCGSGAWGLEALSRGASEAVLVDNDPSSLAACRSNITAAGMEGRATLVRKDARRYLEKDALDDGPFGVVFADPPYADPPHEEGRPSARVLQALAKVLTQGGVALWESRHSDDPFQAPEEWLVEERRYGDTQITRLRLNST